jgi:predicted nuclease of predicted toxin-antitoxin system
MKILVDENIPRMTVDRLRELGHDVADIRGSGEEGLSDPDLWLRATAEERLLITTDKGFTQYRATAEWPGLLVVVRDTVMSTTRG